MLVSITRFRHLGQRLSDHHIANSLRLRGDISFKHVTYRGFGSVDVLELRPIDNVAPEGLMARLFEPRLLDWHGSLMLFRGFEPAAERDTRWGVVQEWRIEVP